MMDKHEAEALSRRLRVFYPTRGVEILPGKVRVTLDVTPCEADLDHYRKEAARFGCYIDRSPAGAIDFHPYVTT
jgi:hypothetical protein